MTIDFNCDVGEGGAWDAELMALITSANIACGSHAGSPATMAEAVALAHRCGVRIGAHPGFEDRPHFGRRELTLPGQELRDLVVAQIQALRNLTPVAYVKPHGGLYNLAARDRSTADVIVEAMRSVDPGLALCGLAGSELVRAGRAHGLTVIEEVFADLTYQADGSLTPRSEEGAMIKDEEAAVEQVFRMIEYEVVLATDGSEVRVRPDTVCLHGDSPLAVAFACRLRREFQERGVEVKASKGAAP